MAPRKDSPTKLGARRREIMAAVDALNKEKAEIDAKLLALDLDETYTGDGVVVSFTPVHTLDSAFITKKYPASKRPEFYKLTLDTAEFKSHFSARELATFQKVTHRISVKDA